LWTSLFQPVIPAAAFALGADGATFVQVAREDRPGVAALRHVGYAPGSVSAGALGAPVFARAALREAVDAARRATGSRVARACVTFPDAWARTMTLDFDLLPPGRREREDVVAWKVKKLLPVRIEDLRLAFAEIPGSDPSADTPRNRARPARLIVSAVPRDSVDSIEAAFLAAGVRTGMLVPSTLALFDGFDSRLAKAAGGNYLFLHRTPATFSLLIAESGKPLFYRQKATSEEGADETQEIRLSLSYHSENLGRGEITSFFLCDETAGDAFPAETPLPAEPLSPALLSADESLGFHAASRPEVWSAVAATLERP
jgi:Tfp pilus assembly PilM family ATPase